MGVIYMHSHAPLPELETGLRTLQPLLDGMIAKDPGDRFQSAEDLLAALGRVIPGHATLRARGGG
jgi:hypothetical protein